MNPLAGGVHRHTVEVRFKDLDAMGHAHHSLPLVYAEEARAAFWRALTGTTGLAGIDYVLGEASVRYHARIRYPARLAVETRVTHVGRRSFELGFDVLDERGDRLASGRTVQIMYDYDAGASKPIPAELRARLEAWRAAAQNANPTSAETRPMPAPST